MRPPRKAIILAAGYGTRMEPLSHTLPKCLLPFWGRPIIEHTLDALVAWGVRDVLVNLHHAPQPLWRHLIDHPRPGLRMNCSYEPDILGTGGALRRAAWFLDNEPFWLVNGDIVFDCDPHKLLRAFVRRRAIAALLMTAQHGPRTVDLHRSGAIRGFRSAHPGAPGTVTFCGLQLLSPDILRFYERVACPEPSRGAPSTGGRIRHPAESTTSIISAYENAIAAGQNVIGIRSSRNFWVDVGTPEGLLQAHAWSFAARRAGLSEGRFVPPSALQAQRRLKRNGVRIAGFTSLGHNVRVARGASLHNVVAMDGARIARGAEVDRAILAPGVRATGHVHRLAVPLPATDDRELTQIAGRLGWNPARTVAQPLAPRGSARSFTRLAHERQRVIVIRYSLDRPENARFAGHARFLASCGVRVPRLLVDLPAQHLVVTEDLGDHDLTAAIQRIPRDVDAASCRVPPPTVMRTYRRVIAAVAHWHTVAGAAARRRRLALEPAFSPRVFRWEHALFRAHYLEGRLGLTPRAFHDPMRDLERVARRLSAEPATLLHRDLQSSNILFVGAEPAFIDFQGMRFGPAVYDLGSLLADPYVMLPAATQVALLNHYATIRNIRNTDRLHDAFWHAVVQRLVQAIGAYGRLSRLAGTRSFERHIVPALEMLDRASGHLYSLHCLRAFIADLRRIEAERGAA